MRTRCPHCLTLFSIGEEQLRMAEGKAHCCRCDQIFDALASLEEIPSSGEERPAGVSITCRDMAPSDDATPPPIASQSATDFEHNEGPGFSPTSSDPTREASDNSLPLAEERAAGPAFGFYLPPTETEESETSQPRFQKAETESHIALFHGIQENSSAAQIQVPFPSGTGALGYYLPPATQTGEAEPAAPADSGRPEAFPLETGEMESAGSHLFHPEFNLSDDLEEIPPSQPQTITEKEVVARSKKLRKSTLIWSLTIVLMLVLALTQLAWFGRERLVKYPEGRWLIQSLCDILGCRVPGQRALERIQVIARSITSHPDKPGALLVSLTFANLAPFPQSYPRLQIKLFSDNEQLVAERLFKPEEYLGYKPEENQTMKPGEPVHVEMTLADPGDDVTGFKFDFL